MKACLQQQMFCSREECTYYLMLQLNEKSTQKYHDSTVDGIMTATAKPLQSLSVNLPGGVDDNLRYQGIQQYRQGCLLEVLM